MVLSLFGPAAMQKREQEASDYCQTYMTLHLQSNLVKTAIYDHPAGQALFPVVASISTVGMMWVSRRLNFLKSAEARKVKLAATPMMVLAGATFGAVGGAMAHQAQRLAAHAELLQQLETVAIPHMESMHKDNRSYGVQSYKQALLMFKEMAAKERERMVVAKTVANPTAAGGDSEAPKPASK